MTRVDGTRFGAFFGRDSGDAPRGAYGGWFSERVRVRQHYDVFTYVHRKTQKNQKTRPNSLHRLPPSTIDVGGVEVSVRAGILDVFR